MSTPVKVHIFGQIYSIRGELEEKYVQKLAKYVDEKMQAIGDATGIVDTQKLAVLAALAIADELHSMQRERSDEEELLREQQDYLAEIRTLVADLEVRARRWRQRYMDITGRDWVEGKAEASG